MRIINQLQCRLRAYAGWLRDVEDRPCAGTFWSRSRMRTAWSRRVYDCAW